MDDDTARRHRSMADDLADLERSDPVVRAAAEALARTSERIVEGRAHALPCRDETCRWHHDAEAVREEAVREEAVREEAVHEAARRAADAELLSRPDLQESLAQMRRGESVILVPRPDGEDAP